MKKGSLEVSLFGVAFRTIQSVLLFLLCGPYIYWGITRLLDVEAGINEMEAYGLLPPAPLSAVAILIQLGASVMVVTGFWRWIGALSLAAFTLAAALIAHPFWQVMAKDRHDEILMFVGHVMLIGCWLVVVWRSLRK
ncbi:DoxX family membrane protein [Rhizobium binxianense]